MSSSKVSATKLYSLRHITENLGRVFLAQGIRDAGSLAQWDLDSPFSTHEIAQPSDLAPLIDHTGLAADLTSKDILLLSDDAKSHQLKSLCVNSSWIALAKESLENSKVLLVSVIGFPLGAHPLSIKLEELRTAFQDGADEADWVLSIGLLREGDYRAIYDEIHAAVLASSGRTLKCILETSLLKDEEKIAATALARLAGASFVKTSTGFGGSGATTEDVALMRQIAGENMGVKASGGIRSYEQACAMIRAGANRLGTSSSLKILDPMTQSTTGVY